MILRFILVLLLATATASAANFPYIRLNNQTNRLADNGVSLTWNGVPIGGGGWDTLWYEYIVPDSEGGMIYALGSTNVLSTNSVAFASNYLTNFWGGPSTLISIGTGTPDPSTLATSNAEIYNYGDYAGNSMSASNSADIYNYGNDAGNPMSATNSYDIYNYGRTSGFSMSATNSFDIYNYGRNAGLGMSVTNSSEIYTYGYQSGFGLIGSYTNIYLIGNQAMPTLTANQMVLRSTNIRLDGAVTATGTLIAPEVDVVTNRVGTQVITNQSGFSGYSTAALPTGVAVGYQTSCTDCLTPWGTGDRVEWDGSAWKTLRARIAATTSPTVYILSCVTNSVKINSPLSDIAQAFNPANTAGWDFPRAIGTSGGTYQINTSIEGIGVFTQFATGVATNGAYWAYGSFTPITAGGFYGSGGFYSVSAAPDGTDNYWVLVGFTVNTVSTYPTSGAYFLYDRYQAYAVSNATCTATWTNNWLAVTARSSSYNLTDTGLPVSTSTATPDRLAVISTTTACYFLTNGVLSVTDSGATTPTVSLWMDKASIVKTSGTTSRNLLESRPWFHVRRAAARTY